MIYSEFLEITGASVPHWYYIQTILPLYIEATEDKRTWCAIYGPGLIAAFKSVDGLRSKLIDAFSASDDLRNTCDDLASENKGYREEIERLKNQLNAYEVYFDEDKRNREEMEERLWRAR